MSISIIITAYRIPRKPDYASVFMRGIRQHEPDTEIILVNCNSKPPYQRSEDYTLVKVPEPFNIGRMINAGLQAATGEWLIIANDDVTCNGKFANTIQTADASALLCKKIVYKRLKRVGCKWAEYPTAYGWLTILHRTLYERLGPVDERIPWDIEYSLRALDNGVNIKEIRVPFTHIHDHRRG
jgi:glycosyltransferase involved in cell wall biosynthesis